jgi:BON domain-containing protein
MNKGLTFGAGLGLGTGLMFLLDPDRGKRRRAMLRDKCAWSARKTGEAAQVTARDIRNRAQGIASTVRSRFRSEQVDDTKLTDRVRSKLGRVVSHPGAIEVKAQDGVVTLTGPILTEELPQLLTTVNHVSGVNEVVNNLEPHSAEDNHPALQGGRARPGRRFEFMQENWSPAARFFAGALGASLAAYGGVRRGAVGAGLGAAGVLLLTRGVTNTGFSHLLRPGESDGGHESIEGQQPSAIRA